MIIITENVPRRIWAADCLNELTGSRIPDTFQVVGKYFGTNCTFIDNEGMRYEDRCHSTEQLMSYTSPVWDVTVTLKGQIP